MSSDIRDLLISTAVETLGITRDQAGRLADAYFPAAQQFIGKAMEDAIAADLKLFELRNRQLGLEDGQS